MYYCLHNDNRHCSVTGGSSIPQVPAVTQKTYCTVECQTDPMEFEMSSGTKRKVVDMSSSLGTNSSIDTSSDAQTSDSTYEPTLSEIEEDEDDETEDESEDEFDGNDLNTDSGFSDIEKKKICEFTMRLMEKDLSHYTGIPKESAYVIDLIANKSGVSKRNLFIILRKIRPN